MNQGASTKKVRSVLFVCAGNTCRSLMAENLARRRFGDSVLVCSAGLRPQEARDAKDAIDTLKFDFGIDASGHIPRDVRTVKVEDFECVVAMDKQIAAELETMTSEPFVTWNIDDPWESDPHAYRRCALEIGQQLASLSV